MAVRSSIPINCRRTIEGFELSESVRYDANRAAEIFTDGRQKYSHTGPWLFGQYTIADTIFTRVVMSFGTCGVEPDGIAGKNTQTVRARPAVIEWVEDSRNETKVIESEEV